MDEHTHTLARCAHELIENGTRVAWGCGYTPIVTSRSTAEAIDGRDIVALSAREIAGEGVTLYPLHDDGGPDDCHHECACGVDRAPEGADKVWRCIDCGLLFRMVPRSEPQAFLVDMVEVEDDGSYDDVCDDLFDAADYAPPLDVDTKGRL